MLNARVRLGRSVVRHNQTHEYAVTLDGEVLFPPGDSEAVQETIAELFHLAEEALSREIERGEGPPSAPAKPVQSTSSPGPTPAHNGSPPSNESSRSESATPKQVQYLFSLGKRKGLSREDLDGVIAQVIGSPRKTGDLTKREAGQIIDHLTHLHAEASR